MSRRIVLIFAVLVVVAALIGVTLSMSHFEGEIAPTPTPEEAVLARVDDEIITYNEWATQYQLDQLMSKLAGQPAPGARATLERMINNILVLRAYSPQHVPTQDEVRGRIQALETGWGIDDATLETYLYEIDMPVSLFEQVVAHLLTVEIAQELLIAEQELTLWLPQARVEADIYIDENLLNSLSYFAEETAQP